ncbi:hypothetical protein BIW11_13281 [Tropilaelaps mercedesae]|uniref:Sushi domain-containing protein n=1 Tax=Tropilaelaps mercedesae TaxID=418985 RepID=A0A1V9X2H4_9ACAR|nr:hypothetical protein BIW11_13281 [Tropilaelaps mercedesae]
MPIVLSFLCVLLVQIATLLTQSEQVTTPMAAVGSGHPDENSTITRRCTFPGSPRHGRVIGHRQSFPDDSTVEFECDHGYKLLGPRRTQCFNGAWTKGVPYCVRDAANSKPAYQMPIDAEHTDSPGLALDGNDETCSMTQTTEGPRMWGVALLEEGAVSTLKVVFGAKIKGAQLEVSGERVFLADA